MGRGFTSLPSLAGLPSLLYHSAAFAPALVLGRLATPFCELLLVRWVGPAIISAVAGLETVGALVN